MVDQRIEEAEEDRLPGELNPARVSTRPGGAGIMPEKEKGTAMRAKNANPSAGPLDSSQSASWISKTPGVCGGDACIRNTRITVWGLVERRNLGASDAEMLDSIPGLTREDLEAAWEYDDQHHEEIEQAIRENEEA